MKYILDLEFITVQIEKNINMSLVIFDIDYMLKCQYFGQSRLSKIYY